jgi:hypothetical protein
MSVLASLIDKGTQFVSGTSSLRLGVPGSRDQYLPTQSPSFSMDSEVERAAQVPSTILNPPFQCEGCGARLRDRSGSCAYCGNGIARGYRR